MKVVFIGFLMLMGFITGFSLMMTYIKGNINKDKALLQKTYNYIFPIIVSFLSVIIGFCFNNNLMHIALLLLNIFAYICVLLYNAKTINGKL